MTYRDQVIAHLGKYRKAELGIVEPGVFKYRGKIYKKEHILPADNIHKRLNILKPYRDEFYNSELSRISFHRYFHHLNSSQALCINLFFPLIKEEMFDLILSYLEIRLPVNECEFEKISPVECTEKNNRKTNFDFYINSKSGENIYFEIKYTEDGFGRAKDDEAHRGKFRFTYEKLLDNNPYIQNDFKTMDNFFAHYQILRNLVHIDKNSRVVFLFPQQNTRVNTQAIFARDKILTDLGREAFHIIYLDDIINYIQGNIKFPILVENYSRFRNKYLDYFTE